MPWLVGLSAFTILGLLWVIIYESYKMGVEKERSRRSCQNCVHFQEFHQCSCREASDVQPGCTDWRPLC